MLTDQNRCVCKGQNDSRIACATGNADKKSVRVQGAVGLYVPRGSPAVDVVGEKQWQSTIADRHFAVFGMYASSHLTLHDSKGMRSTDTNWCVCERVAHLLAIVKLHWHNIHN
ncbi:hypothetical protein AVEN_196893-1 [Araneus ventricosus]|uniref:Uncharacterized protein n=1 Tax=Araneus ventricosus TaxID=182803 RepID=A0A4Y2ECX8_ARAVE|nr:hypothetical protein AVEN_196893-1 [Araneus ventricosus]